MGPLRCECHPFAELGSIANSASSALDQSTQKTSMVAQFFDQGRQFSVVTTDLLEELFQSDQFTPVTSTNGFSVVYGISDLDENGLPDGYDADGGPDPGDLEPDTEEWDNPWEYFGWVDDKIKEGARFGPQFDRLLDLWFDRARCDGTIVHNLHRLCRAKEEWIERANEANLTENRYALAEAPVLYKTDAWERGSGLVEQRMPYHAYKTANGNHFFLLDDLVSVGGAYPYFHPKVVMQRKLPRYPSNLVRQIWEFYYLLEGAQRDRNRLHREFWTQMRAFNAIPEIRS